MRKYASAAANQNLTTSLMRQIVGETKGAHPAQEESAPDVPLVLQIPADLKLELRTIIDALKIEPSKFYGMAYATGLRMGIEGFSGSGITDPAGWDQILKGQMNLETWKKIQGTNG